MDSGTKYYYLEGEYVTVIVILLKSIDVTLFVSFIHLFIHCSIIFIMTYDCDWQLYTNNLTCMIGTKAKKKLIEQTQVELRTGILIFFH